jgi:hypothetical protein
MYGTKLVSQYSYAKNHHLTESKCHWGTDGQCNWNASVSYRWHRLEIGYKVVT